MNNDKNKPQDNFQGFSDESIKEFITNNVDNGKRNIIIVSGENNSGKTSFIRRLKSSLSNKYKVFNIEAVREASNALKSGDYENPFIPQQEKGFKVFLSRQFQKIVKYLRGVSNVIDLSNLGALKYIQDNAGHENFLENFSKIFLNVISGKSYPLITKVKVSSEKILKLKYGNNLIRSKLKNSLLNFGTILIILLISYLLNGELPSGKGFVELILYTPRLIKLILIIIFVMLMISIIKDYYFSKNHYYTIEFENGEKISDKSEGTFQSLPNILLIYLLKYNEALQGIKTLCSILEPESHLHPAAQERLANEYYTAVNEYKGNNLTLVFETHSLSMIKKFAKLSKNKTSEINFIWLNLEKEVYDLNKMKIDFWKKDNGFNYPMGTGLLSEEEEKEIREQYELEIKAQKEIISFFSHTIGNTLYIAPTQVKTAMKLMNTFSNEVKDNPNFSKAMSEILSLNSTFTFIDNMVKTYKVFTSNKDTLFSEILKDDKKEVDAGYLFSIVLQIILNKLLFENDYYSYRKNLLGEKISQTRKAFIEDIMIQQTESKNDFQKVITWLQYYFHFWKIDLSFDLYSFGIAGLKTNLIISILLELIDNSIKHSFDRGNINIKWSETEAGVDFICSNVYDVSNNSERRGGLLFLSKIESMLDKNIEIKSKKEQNIYTTSMIIKTKILNRKNYEDSMD